MASTREYDAPKPSLSVVKQTAFSDANETFQQIDKLRRRIDELVNRLVGFGLEQCGPVSDPAPPADGIFDSLSRGARDASSDVSLAHAALDRLERQI